MNDQAKIEELTRALEASNKSKDMFLSNVAHELRSPLSTMLMHAQMLKGGDLSPEEQKKTGEAIERATARQTQTIDDLLDVARVTSGTMPHQPQPLNLASVVRAAVDNLVQQAHKKNVTMAAELGAAPVDVQGDYNRLVQVLRHVLGNALRFTPKGGAVSVRLDVEGDRAVVRVKDGGPGVEQAWRDVMFNRLTHPETVRPKPQGGIGFGLSVSQHIIEKHGGHLRLDETGPTGSTFAIDLPLRGAA